MPRRIELETSAALEAHLQAGRPLAECVVQGLDLGPFEARLLDQTLRGCLLLGCRLGEALLQHALRTGALVFPSIGGVPYRTHRGSLYSVEELLGDYRPGEHGSHDETLDARVYRHYHEQGGEGARDIRETLAMRLHDHAITDALHDLLEGRKVVAVMGGHSLRRGSPEYVRVARLGRLLTRQGFVTVSGDGPGAMEATHLGSWFAQRGLDELDDGIRTLSVAPRFAPIGPWLDAAFEVRQRYPLPVDPAHSHVSVGIPTWLYGHEPPGAFATHIAKYFANSVREEGLLAIAGAGVIFAPGGPGTVQEVFQDAAQNHYRTFGGPSPMIFLGEEFWRVRRPIFPVLAHMAAGSEYAQWLYVTDDLDEIVARLVAYDRARARPA